MKLEFPGFRFFNRFALFSRGWPAFTYEWRMTATEPPQFGFVSVRAENPIRGVLAARRYVRDLKFKGYDLASITLTEDVEDDGAAPGRNASVED